MALLMDTSVGTEFKISNGGTAKIVKYNNCRDVVVELSGGHLKTVQIDSLRKGKVKDNMLPTVFGVGYIGVGSRSAVINGVKTLAYDRWRNMLERCYYDSYALKNKTYKGCTVCSEWHNFQVFAEWFDDNYIKGFQLDKDIKVKGNKIYSPETCLFVSNAENVIKATAKRYKFISPTGCAIDVYNLSEFCRDNGLNVGNMSALSKGNRRSSHGWTLG